MICSTTSGASTRDASSSSPRTTNANVVTYSPKVFVPLTRACRDSCGYCAFVDREPSAAGKRVYMTLEEIVDVARRGAARGGDGVSVDVW